VSETKEKPADKKQKADAGEQISIQGQKLFRNFARSSRATWKLYRTSKTGLAGLAIALGFFVMAVFAPFISPYNPDFKAPAEDVFIADNDMKNMTAEYNWTAPIGISEPTREAELRRVLVYSTEGVGQVFGVIPPGTIGNERILLGEPIEISLPSQASYIGYTHFTKTVFFIVKEDTIYEYDTNLQPTGTEHHLNFTAKYFSNLWNAYSNILNQARLAFVVADDHNVYLLDKRPPNVYDAVVRTFESSITIPDANITGNPLVIDSDSFANGSVIVVPTDEGVRTYGMNVTTSSFLGYVTNVSIGNVLWTHNYTYPVREGDAIVQVPYDVVDGVNKVTFPYPIGSSTEFGKYVVCVASKDDHVVAYDRENGTVMWYSKLIMSTIRDYDITDLYPSPSTIIVVGTSGDRGFVAGVDPATGLIKYNNSQYTSVEGHLNSAPQYVKGQRTFLFSTDADRIYLLNEILRVNATFGAPGGGSATPTAFLGNIYSEDIITGNFFGVVTVNNSLFIETLTGVNMAPLPPGTYPSGNRYILGTDYEGHDILAWLIYGTRAELMVGVTAAFFSVVIGTIVGLVAGFYSGIIDDLLMRATDVVLSLPGLVIILLFAAVFGPSLLNIIIIIGILGWAGMARIIRSVTLSLKERAFVDAAIIAGASESRLIFKHIAPNVLPYTFLYMTFGISGAIVTEAILAFLGFGDVNYVTWGMMLQYLQISGHTLDAPWWLLPPGIAITLLSLSFYLIGRAFDEVVNPRLRKR
jgi:peptide/nickel transport system permease protein